jgi:hypothetical protein
LVGQQPTLIGRQFILMSQQPILIRHRLIFIRSRPAMAGGVISGFLAYSIELSQKHFGTMTAYVISRTFHCGESCGGTPEVEGSRK